jgi:hypothetical protein
MDGMHGKGIASLGHASEQSKAQQWDVILLIEHDTGKANDSRGGTA